MVTILFMEILTVPGLIKRYRFSFLGSLAQPIRLLGITHLLTKT
jgi:hypothetical protein